MTNQVISYLIPTVRYQLSVSEQYGNAWVDCFNDFPSLSLTNLMDGFVKLKTSELNLASFITISSKILLFSKFPNKIRFGIQLAVLNLNPNTQIAWVGIVFHLHQIFFAAYSDLHWLNHKFELPFVGSFSQINLKCAYLWIKPLFS